MPNPFEGLEEEPQPVKSFVQPFKGLNYSPPAAIPMINNRESIQGAKDIETQRFNQKQQQDAQEAEFMSNWLKNIGSGMTPQQAYTVMAPAPGGRKIADILGGEFQQDAIGTRQRANKREEQSIAHEQQARTGKSLAAGLREMAGSFSDPEAKGIVNSAATALERGDMDDVTARQFAQKAQDHAWQTNLAGKYKVKPDSGDPDPILQDLNAPVVSTGMFNGKPRETSRPPNDSDRLSRAKQVAISYAERIRGGLPVTTEQTAAYYRAQDLINMNPLMPAPGTEPLPRTGALNMGGNQPPTPGAQPTPSVPVPGAPAGAQVPPTAPPKPATRNPNALMPATPPIPSEGEVKAAGTAEFWTSKATALADELDAYFAKIDAGSWLPYGIDGRTSFAGRAALQAMPGFKQYQWLSPEENALIAKIGSLRYDWETNKGGLRMASSPETQKIVENILGSPVNASTPTHLRSIAGMMSDLESSLAKKAGEAGRQPIHGTSTPKTSNTKPTNIQETPAGGFNKIRVIRKSDGAPGTIDPQDFDPNKYEKR